MLFRSILTNKGIALTSDITDAVTKIGTALDTAVSNITDYINDEHLNSRNY